MDKLSLRTRIGLVILLAVALLLMGQRINAVTVVWRGQSAAPVSLSQPGQAIQYYDSTLKQLRISQDGSAFTSLSSGGLLTAGSGAGITVNSNGFNQRFIYKATIAPAAWIAAALTQDITIATVNAKTRVIGVIADTTAAYAGTGMTGTIQISVGKTVGGVEYMLAYDAKTAPTTKGLVNGDLGAAIATSATTPVQGGDLPSWTTTTIINVRLASSVGNIGSGTVTNLTAGTTTFYLIAEVYP